MHNGAKGEISTWRWEQSQGLILAKIAALVLECQAQVCRRVCRTLVGGKMLHGTCTHQVTCVWAEPTMQPDCLDSMGTRVLIILKCLRVPQR